MIGYLALALLVGITTGQEVVAPCRCGAFITVDSGEALVYELPEIEVHKCDQIHNCQNRCFEEFELLSGGGDLNFISSDGVTPVGQVLCDGIGHSVDTEYVYGYSNLCDSFWAFSGDVTIQPLCCDEASIYYECEMPTTIAP